MAFESDHGLTMDGVAGPQVWRALLRAAATGQRQPHGYTYAIASEHTRRPDRLAQRPRILHTLANTGIPAAPTTIGTAPVYLRYYVQIMKGKNPDGTKYADPVYYVSYFRAGEAVHYFPRGVYGYRRAWAASSCRWPRPSYIWPYLTYGTLVTVTAALTARPRPPRHRGQVLAHSRCRASIASGPGTCRGHGLAAPSH